jgi:hypothetical protein
MYLNASMVIELMRKYSHDTPQARQFLAAYHSEEAEVAARSPYLSEIKIREEAFTAACKRLGIKLVRRSEDGKSLPGGH